MTTINNSEALLTKTPESRQNQSKNSANPWDKPWTQPFFRPYPGKTTILIYLIALHLATVVGIVLYPIPSVKTLAWTLGLAFLGGLGTTVAFHRGMSHRAVKLNPIIQHLLVFFAMFNGSGNPQSWVAYHRKHHAFSDKPEDVSSPKHGGFWWSHIRWLYQVPSVDYRRWCPDLCTPMYNFWSRFEGALLALALGVGYLIAGWEGFFWIGVFRLVYCMHFQMVVNSYLHMSKNPDAADTSRNVAWVGPFQLGAWGENWHRNHHSNGASARLGLTPLQIDMGWYLIIVLEKLGLAREVRRP